MKKARLIPVLLAALLFIQATCAFSQVNAREVKADANAIYMPVEAIDESMIGRGAYQDWPNWADSDLIFYYTLDDTLFAVTVDTTLESHCMLNIYSADHESDFTFYKSVQTHDGFPLWGGFYAGEDGYLYVAVGRNNYTESEDLTVIEIIKYSAKDWDECGTAEILGGAENGFPGIYEPFEAGNCQMALQGEKLIVHTCRTMFAMEGVNHQSNITFYIDTATMELTEGTAPYNSHSFNQRVKADETGIYFADHGDAYPRCISLSRHHLDDTPPVRTSVLDIVGEIGDNVTGATLGDMMLSTNKVIITGNSVPQNHTVCGQSGSDGQRNIYLAVTDKATFDVEFKWLTENDPSGNISVGSPRMVQIAEDKFVILYNEFDGEKDTLCCILIDGEGNVIKTKRYEGVFFADNSEPIFYNGDIIWISPLTNSLLTTENYIFRLPHTDLIVLENINIAQDEYNLILGEYVTVDVTFEPKEATGNELTWSFDKEGIAQYVDGKVLGIGAGSTTLTVSCGGLSDSCIINVDGDNRAEYVVRYYIDGEKYTEKRLGYGLVPEDIEVPEKAGFVFSGWKDLPETMPAYDIDVHGEYISAVKIGDVNQDGTVNTADAVCILKHAAQLEILEGNALIAADTNIDGTVNTADAVVILKYSAGMIELP